MNADGRPKSVAPDRLVTDPSSVSFWTQPMNRSWLVGCDGDWMPSRTLPMLSSAGRDSRSDSELPPFVPCTAPLGWSNLLEWDTLSQVHLLGGNRTHTVIELSRVLP